LSPSNARPLDSLPPLLGLCPATKGDLPPLELPIDLFHKSIKIGLFLGSLSSSRNHARSPPDDFRTSLPA
ncbi:MAG: hypothetical protein J7L72_03345, partial [Candidatus Aminicenantes bacterium]|nr:hypothetical protein [Candidatus Aminicenantes bacterium]